MRRAALATLAVLLAAGCPADEPEPDAVDREPIDTVVEGSDVEGPDVGIIEIAELGLTLTLPPSFTLADDPELLLLARSFELRAVLSVAGEDPGVTDHEAEGDEVLSTIDLGAVDGVVVTDAVLEGLPPGVATNELLVSNGSRSFSLIMSAGAADLDDLWSALLATLEVS